MMKYCILLGCCCIFTDPASGQLLQDGVTGKFYFEKKSTEVKGSPFLFEQWLPSRVIFENGKEQKNVILKVDLEHNLPLFLRNDSAFEFVFPLKEFILYTPSGDSVRFRKGFPAAENIHANTYLELLIDGKLTVVKHHPVIRTVRKEYNSAVQTEELIHQPPVLYLQQGNTLYRIRRNGESVFQELMKKDWNLVSDFIKKEKLNLKKEADICRLVRYYNTL